MRKIFGFAKFVGKGTLGILALNLAHDVYLQKTPPVELLKVSNTYLSFYLQLLQFLKYCRTQGTILFVPMKSLARYLT